MREFLLNNHICIVYFYKTYIIINTVNNMLFMITTRFSVNYLSSSSFSEIKICPIYHDLEN